MLCVRCIIHSTAAEWMSGAELYEGGSVPAVRLASSLWLQAQRASLATDSSDTGLRCLNAKGHVTSVELVTLLEVVELQWTNSQYCVSSVH